MSDFVWDASAVLAVIYQEPGWEGLIPWAEGGRISSVNVSEIAAKLALDDMPPDEVAEQIGNLPLTTVPFDHEQALVAGQMATKTRHRGLSLGDRACLALAASLHRPALTADRAWAEVEVGVEVRLLR